MIHIIMDIIVLKAVKALQKSLIIIPLVPYGIFYSVMKELIVRLADILDAIILF